MSTWWGKTTAPTAVCPTTTTTSWFTNEVTNVVSTGIGTPWATDVFNAVTEKDLEHEVFKTPIRILEGLWLAKFGYKFIGGETLIGDEFFSLAGARLSRAGRIERYILPGAAKFRLIEL